MAKLKKDFELVISYRLGIMRWSAFKEGNLIIKECFCHNGKIIQVKVEL